MLIEAKVKVTRNLEGKLRKRTESFLVDKQFFAEAEYSVTAALEEEAASHLVENYEILSLRIAPIKEVASQFEGDHTYVATLRDLWIGDDGTEKNLKYKVLLWADSLTQANQRTHELAREGYDMLIEGIKQVDYEYLNTEENEE